MKKQNTDCAILIVLSIFLLIMAAFLVVVSTEFPEAIDNDALQKAMFFGGLAVFGLSVVLLITGIGKAAVSAKRKAAPKQYSAQNVDTQLSTQNSVARKRAAQKFEPPHKRYMGKKQPTEEKFREISKMDRAQFTVYAAKLFTNKGYDVRFTPVVDNYGIDLLVRHGEKVSAVCCILAQKVLGEKDISFVSVGCKFYNVSDAIVFTNGFFDRSALKFARRTKLKLYDHNVLKEDFLR